LTFDLIKDKNKTVHFIGIGGISMSALAEILLSNGFKVSGSDTNSSPITEKLIKKGAEVYIGHCEENVQDSDLVVYTAAISPDNPELQRARTLNIPLMDRAQFLGQLMKGHKYNIAVSGTHGKTTTTSMISHIIMNANLDPTILVGGELDLINGNVRTGSSEYFITEACEYKASFLQFYPYIAVILNIDEDHLDFYKDIHHIQDTFRQFAAIVPRDGFIVGNAEDPRVEEVLRDVKSNTLSYGLDKGDIQAKNVIYNTFGCPSFDVFRNGLKLFNITLSVPGDHNILNSLSAVCTALALGVEENSIVAGLKEFKGTHKRFEKKGVKDGVTVIDDYAHHPTEIKVTLKTAQKYPHNKIICVFQPHTYTRTFSLLEDFSNSFYDADEVILADIYAAREVDTGIVNSVVLGDRIREKGIKCTNLHSFSDITNHLRNTLKEGDLLLTVGAGDIVKVADMYLSEK
jgi:UDP-N-acetylmuramate--alanine ligase